MSCKGCSSILCAKVNKKALIAVASIHLGRFTQLGTFLSKKAFVMMLFMMSEKRKLTCE